MTEITLLQTPAVAVDGRPVVFPFKRAEALLYYMAVRRSATRQELIALLWESSDEVVGLKNLRNALYTLKKCMGGEILVSPQKSLVVINPEWDLRCDYNRFVWDGDFTAYQGAFLQGFSVKNTFTYEEWLIRTREKLRDQYLSHIARQAKQMLQDGNLDAAMHWAADYLREEPLDEEMTSFLMDCHRKTNQYAKAAQLYQRLKEALAEELGVAPLAGTTMLNYEIMNEWNDTTRQDGQPIPAIPVGRELAYSALRAAVSSFQEGAARQCSQLLVGEVGSGKSELINYFLQQANDLGCLHVRRACLMSEEHLPMSAWDGLMPALGDFVRAENVQLPHHVRAQLGQFFLGFEGECAPEEQPSPLHQLGTGPAGSILMMLTAVTRRRKLLIVLEDIQWMDSRSLGLIECLLRRMDSGSLMMVLTCRSDCRQEVTQFRQRILADGLVRRQRLHPLTREQTRELLSRELEQGATKELANQFYQETGGNLYLLTELTQAYRRNGDVTETVRTMSDILMDRLAGLSQEALALAELISVFELRASASLLLLMVEQNDRLLDKGLAELCARDLIEQQQTQTETYYQFTHQRIGQLVYQRLSYLKHRPLHQRLAQLMLEATAERDAQGFWQVARHFWLAGDGLNATECRIRALELESIYSCEPFPLTFSQRQKRKSAAELWQLAQQETQALSQLRREGREERLLHRLERRLQLIRGRIALFRGETAEGTALLGGLSGGLEQREEWLMIKACYLLAVHALHVQSADLAQRYTATGMRLLESYPDELMMARFQRLRGNYYCLKGDYEKSLYYLLEAVTTLERQPKQAGCTYQLAGTYFDYGRVCRYQQDYAKALDLYRRVMALLEGEEPVTGAVWAYVHTARTAFALEDDTRAKQLFRQGYEAACQTGELWGAAAAAAFYAYYALLDENETESAELLSKAKEKQELLKSPLEEAILCFVSMRMRDRLDRREEMGSPLLRLLDHSAEDYARQGIRLLSGVPDVFETQQLSRSLREGIATEQRFRVSDLYSKNKHFMTE